MGDLALDQADRNLRDAEQKLRSAISEGERHGSVPASAQRYREAIAHYRAAIRVSSGVAKALERTLDRCPTCERRCPGLPKCQEGLKG
jgi:hypothetical protein